MSSNNQDGSRGSPDSQSPPGEAPANMTEAAATTVVQSSWTGDLDIYDIMELKFTNDKMRYYQPVHNWIGTTQLRDTTSSEAPTFLPPPFGIRSPQQAREFNIALLHDRFGRDGVNKRKKKDAARRALIAKMRKNQRERDEESENAFSPMNEYSKCCEPINWELKNRKQKDLNETMGAKDAMKRSVTQNVVRRHAPSWKMGERNHRTKVNRGTPSPGPIYTVKTSFTKKAAPKVSLGGKLKYGGFLDAVGGVRPRSNPDAIGMDVCDWVNSPKLDRAKASSRQKSGGKTFGVRHDHLNPKPDDVPAPHDYAATEAFHRSLPSTKPKTMGFKSKSLHDLQSKTRGLLPGPAAYSPAAAHSKLAFADPPQFSLAGRLKNDIELAAALNDSPGPNKYGVPKDTFSSRRGHAPKHSFGYHKRGKTIIHAAHSTRKKATKKDTRPQTS